MIITYCAMASVTFLTLLIAFMEDKDAVMESATVPFLLIATLLCPVTLPFIILKRVQRFKGRQQTNQRYGIHSQQM